MQQLLSGLVQDVQEPPKTSKKHLSASPHLYSMSMVQVWMQAWAWSLVSVSARWAVPLALLALRAAVIPSISCQRLVPLMLLFVYEKEGNWILCLL